LVKQRTAIINPLPEIKIVNTPTQEYMVLVRGGAWLDKASVEELQKILGKFQAWHEKLSATGKIKGGQPLVRQGKILSRKNGQIVDGPFTESKEAIGGYCLLTASSLEEAVAVLKEFPGLEHGDTIEVRPVAEECPMTARAKQILSERELVPTGV
jgi:hypothetical protein